MKARALVTFTLWFGLFATSASAGAENARISRIADGVIIDTARDQMHLAVCGPALIHVTAAPHAAKPSASQQPWIVQGCSGTLFSLTQSDKSATLTTAKLTVEIGLRDGGLIFRDVAGKILLAEGIWDRSSTRHYFPVRDGMYRLSDAFQLPEDEAIYGLGQHQNGALNYRGLAVSLGQNNTDVAVPILISTRGYGLLWNTASQSEMNNQFPRSLIFSAEAAEGLDYYFLYGPEADDIVHLYRELTGKPPLFGKWAYGLFQSKDRYKTQDELTGIVDRYRSEHIPLDTVVQDWQWWTKWGSSDFNASYPDFAAAVNKIHDQHAHVMISIWPNFDPATPLYQQMSARGFLIDEKGDYDITSSQARDLYWKMLPQSLVDKGIDAFWLDASEPEAGQIGIPPGRKLALGPSDLYTNIFPLLHTQGLYENWRKTIDTKRIFLLTRSAFLGQQRNAAVTWSGDVYSNFWALKRQIPAGLNFSISGIPYWTTDIGGYGYPNGKTSDPEYQEVFTRWFEYGTFCPTFRIHGHRENNENELWSYGPANSTLVQYDRLRYRLLPYIYSLAWQVTSSDYTMMRPLVMDWRSDRKVWDVADQFMFGPALLVNPVYEAGATKRAVYLPQSTWYDFWTGERLDGNQTVQAAAPLDRIPLYVRAGSILPLGAEVQHAAEAPNAAIELRVYPGGNGKFVFYEDEGEGYGYERGARATTTITWDDASRVLTFAARKGSYPGMPAERTFELVWVRPKRGIGQSSTVPPDRKVVYAGREIRVTMP